MSNIRTVCEKTSFSEERLIMERVLMKTNLQTGCLFERIGTYEEIKYYIHFLWLEVETFMNNSYLCEVGFIRDVIFQICSCFLNSE